jgi:hypothetical protein
MAAMMLLFSLLTLMLAPWQQQPERRNPGLNDALTLDGARPILDNARVTVWDFTWTRGVPEAMERTTSAAIWVSVTPIEGQVVYWPKGAVRRAPDSANGTARYIVANIKDSGPATLDNRSAYPNAFPRPGSRKVLENDRVIIWDYTWTTGQPTPVHFHDKDALVVYLRNGALKSTTPDGKSVINPLTVGKTTFNARDRVHTETLVNGESRAIITELK